MPIYEYSCRKCGAQLEVMQKISDEPLTRHEKCGGKLEKEWSRTGFQFKGTGWYVTDYAAKKSGAKEGGGSKESDSKESKGPKESKESKSDSSESKAGKKEPKDKKTAPAPTSGD